MRKFDRQTWFTLPNLLSLYRIFTFPVVLFFALTNHETLYFVLLMISFLTDILDGIVARALKLESELGAKLDSYGDTAIFTLAAAGLIFFKMRDIAPYWQSLVIFITLSILPRIIAFVRFRKISSLHLYSSKIGGYLKGFFFISLFIYGFSPLLYYIMIAEGLISGTEQIMIILIVPELRSDAKGLYWVLKERQWS
jgi:CDP-diacylglycerol--glycerol-3-phosphate 3-phosphatidyltransferase